MLSGVAPTGKCCHNTSLYTVPHSIKALCMKGECGVNNRCERLEESINCTHVRFLHRSNIPTPPRLNPQYFKNHCLGEVQFISKDATNLPRDPYPSLSLMIYCSIIRRVETTVTILAHIDTLYTASHYIIVCPESMIKDITDYF